MEEGDIYRDVEDDLVFRVREIRGTDPDSVVAVEVLGEAVETYRTRREIREGLDEGTVEPAEDVDHGEFETEPPDLPLYDSTADSRVLKYVAVAAVAVLALAMIVPATRLFVVFAIKVAVPLAVVAAAAYVVYRYIDEQTS